VLAISTGPRSPLVVGYFLVIAMSALRFHLPLVRIAAAATILGYVCLLGIAKWPDWFGRAAETDLMVPRYEEMVVIAGLALTGIIVGQVVRRVRGLAEDFAMRLEQPSGDAP
jgi:hypothetical protein